MLRRHASHFLMDPPTGEDVFSMVRQPPLHFFHILVGPALLEYFSSPSQFGFVGFQGIVSGIPIVFSPQQLCLFHVALVPVQIPAGPGLVVTRVRTVFFWDSRLSRSA